MIENRFYKAYCCGDTGVVDKLENEWFIENINSISDIEKNWDTVIGRLNQVAEENEKLKKYNKSQELEIVRLHNLADAMSVVLRELGIYDVYDDEQIENVKRRILE